MPHLLPHANCITKILPAYSVLRSNSFIFFVCGYWIMLYPMSYCTLETSTDNIESYVYRNEHGEICLPGEYLRLTICNAAKFKQDPRSPRKSAFDLFKAGVVALDELCPINGGVKDWDYVDQRRMTIQRNSITRMRPAFSKGWTAECRFEVLVPEYIDPQFLNEVLVMSGRLIGTADSRPSYGRFQVAQFKVMNLE